MDQDEAEEEPHSPHAGKEIATAPLLPPAGPKRPTKKADFEKVALSQAIHAHIPNVERKAYYPHLDKLMVVALKNSSKKMLAGGALFEKQFYNDLLAHGLATLVRNQAKVNQYFGDAFYYKRASQS